MSSKAVSLYFMLLTGMLSGNKTKSTAALMSELGLGVSFSFLHEKISNKQSNPNPLRTK
jgi:hypothetical protein